MRVALRDADGVEVARASGSSGELTVEDVHLWRPGEGYLYELDVELLATATTLVDAYPLPVGVRTVRVDGARFLINGEPFYFKGFGKHEDSAVRGKGHDDAFMVHDFALMEWLGANSFRTSHYPYAEEVLDYADRHGIVVIDETAAVGLNSGLAGGVFGAEAVHDVLRGDDQRRHAGDPPAGDPRADRPRQEPPVRRAVERRQRARVRHAGVARLLRAAGRGGPAAGPDPPGRLRQRHARDAGRRRDHRPVRRR